MPLNFSAAFGSVEQTRHVGSSMPFSVSTNPSTTVVAAAAATTHTKQIHFIQNKSHYHRCKFMAKSCAMHKNRSQAVVALYYGRLWTCCCFFSDRLLLLLMFLISSVSTVWHFISWRENKEKILPPFSSALFRRQSNSISTHVIAVQCARTPMYRAPVRLNDVSVCEASRWGEATLTIYCRRIGVNYYSIWIECFRHRQMNEFFVGFKPIQWRHIILVVELSRFKSQLYRISSAFRVDSMTHHCKLHTKSQYRIDRIQSMPWLTTIMRVDDWRCRNTQKWRRNKVKWIITLSSAIHCNRMCSSLNATVQWRWKRFISRWIIVGIEAFRLRNRVCPWNNCTLFVSICCSVSNCLTLALACIRRYRTSRTASTIEIKLSNSFWHHIWIRWMCFVLWHTDSARKLLIGSASHIKQFRFVIWFWLRLNEENCPATLFKWIAKRKRKIE